MQDSLGCCVNLVSSTNVQSAFSLSFVLFPTTHAPLLRFALEPRWSETGDRYIIKLFRDYVFHQVDEHGKPLLNMSHVLTCLNKVRPPLMYLVYSIHFPPSWTLVQTKGSCWFPETRPAVWSSVTRKSKPAWRVLSSTSCPLLFLKKQKKNSNSLGLGILRDRVRRLRLIFNPLDDVVILGSLLYPVTVK